MKKNRRLFLILSVFTQLFSFAGALTMLFKKNKTAAGGFAVVGGTAAVVMAALIGTGKKKKKVSSAEKNEKDAVCPEKTDEEIVRDTEISIAEASVSGEDADDASAMLDTAINILKSASEPLADADAELENELNNID